MPLPLLALAAGTVARGVGARAAAGAVAEGTSPVLGQAAQFGGRALQSRAFNEHAARQERQQHQQPPAEQQQRSHAQGFMSAFATPTLADRSAQAFNSAMLQPGQFIVREPGT